MCRRPGNVAAGRPRGADFRQGHTPSPVPRRHRACRGLIDSEGAFGGIGPDGGLLAAPHRWQRPPRCIGGKGGRFASGGNVTFVVVTSFRCVGGERGGGGLSASPAEEGSDVGAGEEGDDNPTAARSPRHDLVWWIFFFSVCCVVFCRNFFFRPRVSAAGGYSAYFFCSGLRDSDGVVLWWFAILLGGKGGEGHRPF